MAPPPHALVAQWSYQSPLPFVPDAAGRHAEPAIALRAWWLTTTNQRRMPHACRQVRRRRDGPQRGHASPVVRRDRVHAVGPRGRVHPGARRRGAPHPGRVGRIEGNDTVGGALPAGRRARGGGWRRQGPTRCSERMVGGGGAGQATGVRTGPAVAVLPSRTAAVGRRRRLRRHATWSGRALAAATVVRGVTTVDGDPHDTPITTRAGASAAHVGRGA